MQSIIEKLNTIDSKLQPMKKLSKLYEILTEEEKKRIRGF